MGSGGESESWFGSQFEWWVVVLVGMGMSVGLVNG